MKNVSTKINMALLLIGLAFGAKSFGQQPSGQVLIDAVQKGVVAQVKKLIAEGANVNTVVPGYGATPLIEAARERNPEMVQMLLDKGAKVNVADRRGITPLWIAVHKEWGSFVDKNKIIKVVKMLLSKGANVNVRSFLGQTVLGEAARRNNSELMKMLLAKKPKVNIPDFMGMTPLMFAAQKRNPVVVKLLLDAGANKTIKNAEGKTAVDLAGTPAIRAVLTGASSLGELKGLAQSQLLNKTLEAIVNEDVDSVKKLVAAGVDVNAQFSGKAPFKSLYFIKGIFPLMVASEVGNTEIVKILLGAGAKANRLFQGATPLMVAPSDYEIVKILLDAGVDKTIKMEGKTAADRAETPAIRNLINNYPSK